VNRTRFARRGDLRIGYELRGRLHCWRPWLVLIQGLGFDRAGWQPVRRRLGRRFRLVLVDNRGSGRSDLPAGPFTVADMAGDVVAVLDQAGIARAHVLGVSLGGMVAQELAAGHPERVDGLVLVSTSPGWPFAFPMPAATAGLLMMTAGQLPGADALRRHAENALSADAVERHPDLVSRLVELHQSHPADPRAAAAQAAAGASYVSRLRQRRIRARTLILHGTADAVVDPRNARLLARRIRGARLVEFPGLGHLLCWQDPARFAAEVSAFLRAGQRSTAEASRC
jgi:3-oxoadipate enol-lactonase